MDFGDKPLTEPSGTLLRRRVVGYYAAIDNQRRAP